MFLEGGGGCAKLMRSERGLFKVVRTIWNKFSIPSQIIWIWKFGKLSTVSN